MLFCGIYHKKIYFHVVYYQEISLLSCSPACAAAKAAAARPCSWPAAIRILDVNCIIVGPAPNGPAAHLSHGPLNAQVFQSNLLFSQLDASGSTTQPPSAAKYKQL